MAKVVFAGDLNYMKLVATRRHLKTRGLTARCQG